MIGNVAGAQFIASAPCRKIRLATMLATVLAGDFLKRRRVAILGQSRSANPLAAQ